MHVLRNVLSVLPKTHQQLAVAARCAREAEEDVLTTMSFPVAHWRQIRGTNPLERLNREIRRRNDVVGAFPVPRCFAW